MEEVFENMEIMERYHEGKMSPEELASFEVRLLTDSNLKEEFDLYKNIVEVIRKKGEENFREKLRNADLELGNPKKINLGKKKNLQPLAIAASLVFLIAISIVWMLLGRNSLPDLADKYYEREKGLAVEMSMSNGKMNDVMSNYNSGNYPLMTNQINELLKTDSKNDTLNYFLGVANYETKNYASALSRFEIVPAQSAYFQRAQFRMVLTYLKTEQKDSARKLIDKCLLVNEHLYKTKLEKLRSELSK
jgi:hypothetical protein